MTVEEAIPLSIKTTIHVIAKRTALQISFILGSLLSLTGVRSLSLQLNMPSDIAQMGFFRSLDVILIEVLISGGSERIHQVITSSKVL